MARQVALGNIIFQFIAAPMRLRVDLDAQVILVLDLIKGYAFSSLKAFPTADP